MWHQAIILTIWSSLGQCGTKPLVEQFDLLLVNAAQNHYLNSYYLIFSLINVAPNHYLNYLIFYRSKWHQVITWNYLIFSWLMWYKAITWTIWSSIGQSGSKSLSELFDLLLCGTEPFSGLYDLLLINVAPSHCLNRLIFSWWMWDQAIIWTIWSSSGQSGTKYLIFYIG